MPGRGLWQLDEEQAKGGQQRGGRGPGWGGPLVAAVTLAALGPGPLKPLVDGRVGGVAPGWRGAAPHPPAWALDLCRKRGSQHPWGTPPALPIPPSPVSPTQPHNEAPQPVQDPPQAQTLAYHSPPKSSPPGTPQPSPMAYPTPPPPDPEFSLPWALPCRPLKAQISAYPAPPSNPAPWLIQDFCPRPRL